MDNFFKSIWWQQQKLKMYGKSQSTAQTHPPSKDQRKKKDNMKVGKDKKTELLNRQEKMLQLKYYIQTYIR